MKFLCLAGSGTNEKTLEQSLGPLTQALSEDEGHTFRYLAGTVHLPPSKDMDENFGPPPHLNFLESSWPGASNEQLQEVSASVPPGLTPEDETRYIDSRLPPARSELLAQVLEKLHRLQETEGPFECVIGHSEGAKIAASFVLDSIQRARERGGHIPPRCAIFFNGTVPSTVDGKRWLLADEVGPLIPIPTCHILANNDKMVSNAVALYHLCNEELATMVDHGRGHTIPKDSKSCSRMLTGIRRTLKLAQENDTGAAA